MPILYVLTQQSSEDHNGLEPGTPDKESQQDCIRYLIIELRCVDVAVITVIE